MKEAEFRDFFAKKLGPELRDLEALRLQRQPKWKAFLLGWPALVVAGAMAASYLQSKFGKSEARMLLLVALPLFGGAAFLIYKLIKGAQGMSEFGLEFAKGPGLKAVAALFPGAAFGMPEQPLSWAGSGLFGSFEGFRTLDSAFSINFGKRRAFVFPGYCNTGRGRGTYDRHSTLLALELDKPFDGSFAARGKAALGQAISDLLGVNLSLGTIDGLRVERSWPEHRLSESGDKDFDAAFHVLRGASGPQAKLPKALLKGLLEIPKKHKVSILFGVKGDWAFCIARGSGFFWLEDWEISQPLDPEKLSSKLFTQAEIARDMAEACSKASGKD